MNIRPLTRPGHRPPDPTLVATLLAQASVPPPPLLAPDPAAPAQLVHVAAYDLGGDHYAVTRQFEADEFGWVEPRTVQVCSGRLELKWMLDGSPLERGLAHLALGDWDGHRSIDMGDQLDLGVADIACYVWAAVCHGQPLPHIELGMPEDATWQALMGDDVFPDNFASTSALGTIFDKACKDVPPPRPIPWDGDPGEWENAEMEYGAEVNWLSEQGEQCKRLWVRWQEARVSDMIRTLKLAELS